VINVSGIIMNGDGFVKQQIDRVRDDENVKAVVLRIDSPGGTVTGSDYILHHLRELRKHKAEENGRALPIGSEHGRYGGQWWLLHCHGC
jgi:hypothetical protein